MKIVQLSSTNQHIDVLVEGEENWRLTGVYDDLSSEWNERTWSDLGNLYALYKIS